MLSPRLAKDMRPRNRWMRIVRALLNPINKTSVILIETLTAVFLPVDIYDCLLKNKGSRW